MEENLSWIPPYFHVIKKCDGYISGIVNTEAELAVLLEVHSRSTCTSYVKWSDHVNDKGRHLWKVEDYSEDVPVIVRRRDILVCENGKAPKRRKDETEPVQHDHIKKRMRVYSRKKVDCPAKVFIRHVIRYDTFSVKGDASRRRKEDTMKKLKQELSQTEVPTSTFIHVKLPLMEAHQNHKINSWWSVVDNGAEGAQSLVWKGKENTDKPERPERKIKLEQVALRKELKKLTEASYVCEDLESLRRTTALLKILRQSIKAHCRRANGLMIKTKSKTKKRKEGRKSGLKLCSETIVI